jgi:hypothetical protein
VEVAHRWTTKTRQMVVKEVVHPLVVGLAKKVEEP